MLRLPRLRSPWIIIALVAASLMVPAGARAAGNFTVTRSDDPAPNGCAVSDCSLREAILAANASPGSTVRLLAGTFTLTRSGGDATASNASIGDLDIMVAMTVLGAGNGSTTVQAGVAKGAGIHRIFDVHSTNPVSISGMRIRFGTDTESQSGGCIKANGVLTLVAVVVTGCTSPAGGGGIAAYRSLAVRDSVVSDNSVSSATRRVTGGGIAGGPQPSGAAGTVTIVRTQILNNSATATRPHVAYGGGFVNTGIMTITDSLISGNTADSSAGGISDPRPSSPDGWMTIERTTITGNKARRDAGGVDNDGTMNVIASTFSDNQAGFNCTGGDCAQAYAGGLLNTATATANVVNSTFSGNTCGVSGGGLLNSRNNATGVSGTLRIGNSTIVGNTCPLGAGVTSNSSGQTYIKNTIIANNTPGSSGGDCSGVVTSQRYNLIRNTMGCTITGDTTGNLTNTDPLVGALANNGGPTFTRALLPGSPAINAGDPSGCKDWSGATLTTDQRGFARPVNGRCDMSAYEVGLNTSAILWTASNTATVWQMNGSSFVSSKGYAGPGADWLATSYSRNPDTSYQLLWTQDNAAKLWWLAPNHTVQTARTFVGPAAGAGWTATSVFPIPGGAYELLWTKDNGAEIWKINADGSWGGALRFTGPAAGWKATSYYRANDNTRRLMWASGNQARIWTLSATGTFVSTLALTGPTGSWKATSYNLNDDGTFNVLWTADALARVWTLNADGTFRSQYTVGSSTGWTAQSYFFK